MNDTIEEIQFSAKAFNSMKRTGIFTIGDIFDALQDESLLKIGNLGKKSYCEIQTKILWLRILPAEQTVKDCIIP